jgi:hypothetical protein
MTDMEKVEMAVNKAIEELTGETTDKPERHEPVETKVLYQQQSMNDYPCYEVKRDGSNIHLIHDTDNDILYISHAVTKYQDDFKKMMNKVTEELATTHIKFTMVVNEDLINSLQGFTQKTEIHEELGDEVTVLEGEWKPEKYQSEYQ